MSFEYRISVVDAEPGSRAIEYVRRSNEQSLNAELRKKARNLIGDVALDYENAARMEVVEGKLSEEEAILKIQRFRQASYGDRIRQIKELRESSLITDIEARSMIKKMMLSEDAAKLTGETGGDGLTDSDLESDIVLDRLYEKG